MVLEIQNLSKHYGQTCALDGFSYRFERGIYGILGANGAGKSTLMSLITDTLKRESGQILYDGEDILKMGAAFRQKVGYMPQEQGFYEKMSVRGFLLYMAQIKGIAGKDARKQIPQLLSVVNLEQDEHRRMETLSGGMKQRVLLAQALLGQPEVVILDEPTAGLDPWERRRLCRYIKDIGRHSIVFLTSHIVSDIEDTADTVLIMKQGHLVCSGTPKTLLEKMKCKTLEEVFLVFFSDEERGECV